MAKVASSPPRRQNQREKMQQQARQGQRMRRILLTGAITAAVLGITIGIWAITSRVGPGPGAQALYQFHTQDIHSLAFDPGDANTIFFGHHTGLKISHDAGITWQDVSVCAAVTLPAPWGASWSRARSRRRDPHRDVPLQP